MFASVSRCVISFGVGRRPCPGERVFAAFGGNEGYGACADEKQDKGLASEPMLRPVTSARSAGSLQGFQRRRLWRLLKEISERLASLFPQAQVFQRK